MFGKLKIGREKVEVIKEEEKEKPLSEESQLGFKPGEQLARVVKRGPELAAESTISIPEFLEGEPYPYFYHTWNKLLLCNLKDVAETFHINNDSDLNIYVFNNDLNDDKSICSNFETQHHKYGNSLQNYYTIVNQKPESIAANWKEMERIDITSITPIYLQKCENIMSTLLFMPLDQCHDFRGGRTSGSSSWVTETSKGVLNKDVDLAQLTNGITRDIYSNDFMNTLIKTSFSGKQGIVGIMVIGDDSFQLLSNSVEYKNGVNLDIQKIMDSFGQFITIGGDINMNCDPRGNKLTLNIEGKDVRITFLGFTSDGWDKGMHDVWSMNERKHIFSIKIDKIIQLESGEVKVDYSGDKITIIENIVPCYEMLYKSKQEGNQLAFINNFEIDGKKITKSNFNDFFSQESFDILYRAFLSEIYRTDRREQIVVEEDDVEDHGGGGLKGGDGEIDKSGLVRGATYKFYGVRAPDSKTSEGLTSEYRTRYIIYENIFIEILKKLSKNISPQIHPDFKYPQITDINCSTESEQMNDRIKKVNDLYEIKKRDIYANYPKVYNEADYNSLKTKMDNGCDSSTEDRIIIKQFGTVNDMNIAPVVEKIIDSLNCSDNCKIINVERLEDEDDDEDELDLGAVSEEDEGITTAASESGSDTSEVKTKKTKTKKAEVKLACQNAIETNIEEDLNNKYPFKFQVVSGVLDSSGQGGENMPEYFPPEIDIFMTIFGNDGKLQGAIVRMTFLKVILTNTTNTKNNARVYSHFAYIDFDEINLECEDKLGDNWKFNSENYPFALKQLLQYVVSNTSFLPRLTNNLISNFELKLKDGITFKRWFFYFSDSLGPSVSDGINDVVVKIFSGRIGFISDDNINISESIVKVAQKLYMDSPKLREIFTQQQGVVRSYAFESLFLLRIKYIGDKSRCTDSLFLNRNKYAECIQITGDENAYFTALINGASTIYSPKSRFALYFAPYFTYGDVESEGKFLMNLGLYKETLLKGESPTMFKISSSSTRKRSINTEAAIPFESSLIKKELSSGVNVRNKANEIIKFVESNVDRGFAIAADKSRIFQEYLDSNNTQKLRETKKILDGYVKDYNDLKGLYDQLKITVERTFIPQIDALKNGTTGPYYNKIIEELNNVFVDNEFIIEPVNLTDEDFNSIKQEFITFFEKAIQSMEQMTSESYNKDNQPQMLDINGQPVVDKKLPKNAYNDLKKYIPIYKKILQSLELIKTIEDFDDFYSVLKEVYNLYTNNISTLTGASINVIFWNSDINRKINFIFSISDIVNHILPNIKIAKSKFASQTKKYDKLNPTIDIILGKIHAFFLSIKSPASAPSAMEGRETLDTTVEVARKGKAVVSAPAILQTPIAKADEGSNIFQPQEKGPSVLKARLKVGREKLVGGGPNEESYRKNQIYILKCFSDLIKTNNSEYEDLITPDKLNFNYENIDSIHKYCVSILMLQVYYSFNSFQPKLKSLQDITDEIATLNEDTSTLQDAINIRNYYSQIINIFVDIEYLQTHSIDHNLELDNVEFDNKSIIKGDTLIYDLKQWSDISFSLITFILNNLRLINSGPNKFVNKFDDVNYIVIHKLHSLLRVIDVNNMDGYYELSKSREIIDKLEDFTQEEKTNLFNQISIVESYEYLCLFFIKYCNNFLMRITNNQLNYSTNGLIYDYEIIKNKLGKELTDKFDSITINIDNVDRVEIKLFSFNESGNLKNDLESITNILLELSSVPEIVEIPSEDVGKGLFPKTPYLIKQSRPFDMSKYRVKIPRYGDNQSLVAGTAKNKKDRNAKKTRNNKIKNKRVSIKKRENKIKRNTRRQ